MPSTRVEPTEQNLKTKVAGHCVTHPCIYFGNHFYFWFSVYLWILLHNSDSNQFTWEIYENSLLACDLIKFILNFNLQTVTFLICHIQFQFRFVLSFTTFSAMYSMRHIHICNIRKYRPVQSIYLKFLYFHKTIKSDKHLGIVEMKNLLVLTNFQHKIQQINILLAF